MATDPRLQHVALLALAAYRLQQRRQRAVPDWRYSEGLASLLEAARHLPPRDPVELPRPRRRGQHGAAPEGSPGVGAGATPWRLIRA